MGDWTSQTAQGRQPWPGKLSNEVRKGVGVGERPRPRQSFQERYTAQGAGQILLVASGWQIAEDCYVFKAGSINALLCDRRCMIGFWIAALFF